MKLHINSSPQNLNLGRINTTVNATNHPIPIYAYKLNLAHQPLPSVIFLNIPILLPAASIPPTVLSNAAAVRSTKLSEPVTESEKESVAVLSALARVKRESVRAFCSSEWWFMRASVEDSAEKVLPGLRAKGEVDGMGLVGIGWERENELDDVTAVSCVAGCAPPRARRVDVRFAAATVVRSLERTEVEASSVLRPADAVLMAGA